MLRVGDIVADKYVLTRKIGSGSMGAVFAARHRLTQNEVALKILNTNHDNVLTEVRFRREVSISSRIAHDGIVKVYDAGTDTDGSLFLAMELLNGESFRTRALRSGFTRLAGFNVVRAMLEPLSAAHAEGIVHRDIKPENVFLHRRADGSEVVKLVDFGIARDLLAQSSTGTNMGIGTPYYMSPEQATNAREVLATSDIWSTGVILYWLLTGSMPFQGSTPFNTLNAVISETPVPIDAGDDATLSILAQITMACLQKDPAKRPRDATGLLTSLNDVLGSANPLSSSGAIRYQPASTLEIPLTGSLERVSFGSGEAPSTSFRPKPFIGDFAPVGSSQSLQVAPSRAKSFMMIAAAFCLLALGGFLTLQVLNARTESIESVTAPPSALVSPAPPHKPKPAEVKTVEPPAAPTLAEPVKAAEPAPVRRARRTRSRPRNANRRRPPPRPAAVKDPVEPAADAPAASTPIEVSQPLSPPTDAEPKPPLAVRESEPTQTPAAPEKAAPPTPVEPPAPEPAPPPPPVKAPQKKAAKTPPTAPKKKKESEEKEDQPFQTF